MPDSDLTSHLNRIDRMRNVRSGRHPRDSPDLRDGSVYRIDPDTRTALKLALVTGRPLLLLGESGTGKSSLAPYVARNLRWRYYEQALTSRTSADDLLYRHDTLRRLSDATVGKLKPDDQYVSPGVLWWALEAESAARQSDRAGQPAPGRRQVTGRASQDSDHAIVLLDEIDKVEADVPDALLVPLGSLQFDVPILGTTVSARSSPSLALIIITTNEERQLSDAFVRRCIVHRLEAPSTKRLEEIGLAHLRARRIRPDDGLSGLVERLAERITELRDEAVRSGERGPSTAEFLDAVFAVVELGQEMVDDNWDLIERLVLTKPAGDRTLADY